MHENQGEPAELLDKINRETAKLPWRELQRFFAQGRVIVIASELDLVATAGMVAGDRAEEIAARTSEGRIGKVSDEQARAWLDADAVLWTVVVKPWILVQESDSPGGPSPRRAPDT